MLRARVIALVLTLLLSAGTARPEPIGDLVQLLGHVTMAARPVENALIVAFNLGTRTATQTMSAPDGSFQLPPLVAGVYRVIAVKRGLAPAVATLVPKGVQKVALRMQGASSLTMDQTSDIWEIRGSLPSDVLRELSDVLSPETTSRVSAARALKGEMSSVTAVHADQDAASLAKTAVRVRGNLGGGWSVGFRGQLQRLDDSSIVSGEGSMMSAESSDMSMEIRSSLRNSYKLATTTNIWKVNGDAIADRYADLRSHNFEWNYGESSVRLRYLAQENLFPSDRLDSELFELSGDTSLIHTGRNAVDVSVRLTQQNGLSQSDIPTFQRLADITARGSYIPVSLLTVNYGLRSRTTTTGSEWSPQTGAEIRLTPTTALLVSGLYKVSQQGEGALTLPEIILWSDGGYASPRYLYSVGIVSGVAEHGRLSATATVSAIDSFARVVFDDQIEQFGDGFYLEAGDRRRDIRVAYEKQLNRFAVNLSTVAGMIQSAPLLEAQRDRRYLVGAFQSTFHPSGTSIDLTYRHLDGINVNLVDQPADSQRVNLQMSQSLHLPVNLRLLVGVELARGFNSSIWLDPSSPLVHRRFLGGLSVAF
ncbi:MAG TPA: carboxypeptidase-like regulatory domain-containing protein [Thermoanaerobaculia bacterium]|nr:carboxypeptidase-like regulatory domain-containing protein [Thermoanaerobaculia bacterium]